MPTDLYTPFSIFGDANSETCSIGQSSAIGDYDDALQRPGTSFLWLGIDRYKRMHLSREHVAELVALMQYWLTHGTLS